MLFLKRAGRKPLNTVLFMMSALIGVLLLILNDRVMADNEASVEELMNLSVITCHIIANNPTEAPVRILPMQAEMLTERDEVADWFAYERGPFYLNGSDPADGFFVVYATTDYEHFFRETYVECKVEPEYADADFATESYVCFADKSFLSAKELAVGDTIDIRGGRADTSYNPNAPLLSFRIIGSYDAENSSISSAAIVVPESCFFAKGAQRITYDSETYMQWYRFHFFSFTLNPKYNDTFEETVARLLPVVEEIGDYSLHTDAREMENALRPLEQRMMIQRALTGILRWVFMLLSLIVAAVMGVAERQEILIRRLFGEHQGRIIGDTALAALLLMGVCLLPAALCIVLLASDSVQMLRYLVILLILSFVSFCVVLLRSTFEPVIPMYQSLNKET
ncbi:MAG: hypothetical protein IJP92_10510 [Lachnospiraceae bacterium]|nr:hypothetical protein [Lachnospiraceae bacterium]